MPPRSTKTEQQAREEKRLRSAKFAANTRAGLKVIQWLYPFFVKHARELTLSDEEITYLETTVKPVYQKIKLYGVKKID